MTENLPSLWLEAIPRPGSDGHKYDRGHAVVFGAPELTGASRLASEAASRMGAGLVSVVADGNDETYRVTLPPDIMVRNLLTVDGGIRRASALCAGSGGITDGQKASFFSNDGTSDSAELTRVLDADLLTEDLDFDLLDERSILTPHHGEFTRMFGATEETAEARKHAVLGAARQSGSIIVLKGNRTVIAHPDGRVVINHHASPWLAKAGTGDVLAGMITGLCAQAAGSGMEPFLAACAAVWVHGEAGRRIGPGLIAGDISNHIPAILHDLLTGEASGV